MLEQVGDVFLSSWDTIKKGDVYVLGFNPGGKPIGRRIKESLALTAKDAKEHGLSYYESEWDGRNPGAHPHQLRVKKYLNCLRLTPKAVPISNVLFLKDRTVRETGNKVSYLDACWPVHEDALKIIQPKIMLCLGNGEHPKASAYAYIRQRINTHRHTAGEAPVRECQKHTVKWFESSTLYGSKPHSPILVIGVRHPSRFEPSDEALEAVSHLYKQRIESAE